MGVKFIKNYKIMFVIAFVALICSLSFVSANEMENATNLENDGLSLEGSDFQVDALCAVNDDSSIKDNYTSSQEDDSKLGFSGGEEVLNANADRYTCTDLKRQIDSATGYKITLSKGTYYVIPVSMQNYNTSYLQQVYASGVWYGIVGIKSSVEYIAGNGLRYIGLTGDGLTINSNGRPVITDITDGTLCNLTEHVGKITLSKDTTINVTISYNGTGYYPVLALVLLPA